LVRILAWIYMLLPSGQVSVGLPTFKLWTFGCHFQVCQFHLANFSFNLVCLFQISGLPFSAPPRTASSESLNPQGEIGKARSQSPLCGARAARNRAIWWESEMEDSTWAWAAMIPGLSQNDCLPDSPDDAFWVVIPQHILKILVLLPEICRNGHFQPGRQNVSWVTHVLGMGYSCL